MKVSTTKVIKPGVPFGHTKRAQPNLNSVAEALISLDATTPERAISPPTLSKLTGIDRSHLLRLLTDRPGFVRTISIVAGKRGLGFYMLPEFVEAGVEEGSAFPRHYARLFRPDLPLEVVISDGSDAEGRVTKFDRVSEVLPAARVEYSGKSPVGGNILIDFVTLNDETLAKMLKYHGELTRTISYEITNAIAKALDGKVYSLTTLESHMVSLVSTYMWLREHHKDPEVALIIQRHLEGKG